jgi:hypothetical protein
VSDPYHLDDWKYVKASEEWVLVPGAKPVGGGGH